MREDYKKLELSILSKEDQETYQVLSKLHERVERLKLRIRVEHTIRYCDRLLRQIIQVRDGLLTCKESGKSELIQFEIQVQKLEQRFPLENNLNKSA